MGWACTQDPAPPGWRTSGPCPGVPAGLLPLQADTAAFRRLPAPAPPVAGLSSLAPWAPRGLCSRLCRDAHSRRLNPADPHHCCFSTRDATSLLVLQSNFRGRGFPRLCTARESGGTWLLGCSPGFPPWVETSGQERGSGRQRQASSASSPNTPRSFWGQASRGHRGWGRTCRRRSKVDRLDLL